MNKQIGQSILLYSDTGVGKTYSLCSLASIGKTCILNCEERDIRVISNQIKDKKHELKIVNIADYTQLLKALDEIFVKSEKTPLYDFVCIDGMTFMQGKVKIHLEDNASSKLEEKRRKELALIEQFNIGESGWGALGSILKRVTLALNHLCKRGIITVMTTHRMENNKYFSMEYAPAFQGRDFTIMLPAFFDHIGYMEHRFEKGKQVYPSAISFVSNDGDYMAKSCLEKLRRRGVCEFAKIMKIIKSEEQREEAL